MGNIDHALREVALAYCAHDPMHPASPKWAALAKLLPAPRPEPESVPVAIEFREQPATEGEALRLQIDDLRRTNADLMLKVQALMNPQQK